MKEKISQKSLKNLLMYNPWDGLFYNKTTRGNRAIYGHISGNKSTIGYIRITISGKEHLAHRLAWLFVYGYLPENGLDHKDRIRHHNWIDNLREATQQCNMRNRSVNSNNKSGTTGVCWCESIGKWMAYISVNSKSITLGYFDEEFNAVKARWSAEKKYKFPNCCTTSSAYEYLKSNNLI